MKGKNGIVDFSRARVSRKKVSPGRYGGNIAIFFGLIPNFMFLSNAFGSVKRGVFRFCTCFPDLQNSNTSLFLMILMTIDPERG